MKNKILIVDDNRLNRRFLSKILEKEYDIVEATNGKEGLSIIQEQYETLAAIILDLIMPVMSGRELLIAMNGEKRYANLPVLIATGEHNQEVERECLSLGAWDFVIKPYDPMIIKLRLSNIIGRSQTHLLKKIKILAERDSLTELYNRQFFMSQTGEMLKYYQEETFVLIRMDIDHFRLYNSSLGSKAGNALLIEVAKRIQQDIREAGITPKNKATYGRIESDVFCICVPYRKELLEKIIKKAKERLQDIDKTYRLKASFGLYIIEDPKADMEEMYSYTVEAASKCKHNLNVDYMYYGKNMSALEKKAQIFTNELELALKEHQFLVYLQPKYSVESGRPCGAEALVRWQHPEWGMVSPGEFIPVFEQNGLIVQIDYYMWESVCILLKKWMDAGQTVYPVSVNISRISMYNPKIVDKILELTDRYEIPRKLLNLEITESAYMSNPDLMEETIIRFRELGFVILMDDFGSGYSSLNTLKNIEVDILKIDMKFLPSGHENVKSEKILASVARMAGWLGMPVVVEGVETREQKDFLESIGCNYIQGYYFAKPMPVEDYETLMAQQKIYLKANENISKEVLKQFDELWSSDSSSGALLRSVAVPFAIVEYGSGRMDILRMNEPFRKQYGTESFVQFLNYKEQTKLEGAVEECILNKENSECECLFFLREGGNQWQHIRFVYIGTIDKTSLLGMTLSDVTTQRRLEKELNHVFNCINKQQKKRNSLLVIDDLQVSREVLLSLFEEEYEVLQAEDGEKGLSILKENCDEIVAILLDMIMPEMDGKEFLSYKNNMPMAAEIPVIIISSETDEKLQINMLAHGVNDYVTKPFIPAVVKKRVRNVIEYNSRFQNLVREYYRANYARKTVGQNINLTEYPYEEILYMMEFMNRIFDVVRLVDPKKTAIVTLKADGTTREETYSCFKVWGKDTRCENCSSMCAFEGHCAKNKFELMKENIFYVVSQPVEIRLREGKTQSFILEIVSKISDETTVPKQEVMDIYALLENTYNMIYQDPLTNIYNRRYFDEGLFLHHRQNEVAKKVAMIMLDLHHFKMINDTYGHQTGDKVLMEVAHILQKEIRAQDSLIRYGGDEFVIILTDCEKSYIIDQIQRYSRVISKIHYGPGNQDFVEADFGFSYTENFRKGDDFLYNMLQIADEKMYQRKKNRKNNA